MTKDEAFNRCWSKYYKEHSWNYMDEELSSDLAYYFWKSALEQPTQEPVAYFKKWEDKSGEHKDIKFSNSEGYKPLYTQPAPRPTQEPVAWMHCVDEDITEFNDFQACPKCEPLYTHPKEWISLSDDEIIEKYIPIWGVMINARDRDETIEFARAIEAKLKEKNS